MDMSPLYDAFILSDYNKGVLSDSVINTIIEFQFMNREVGIHSPVIVDAKKNFHRFQGAYCLKGNNKEIESVHHHPQYLQNHGIKLVCVTCGESGISWYTEDGGDGVDGVNVPIVDVCGAGDTVTAMLAIGLARVSENFRDVVALANLAASEVCQHPGVYAIQQKDLLKHSANE